MASRNPTGRRLRDKKRAAAHVASAARRTAIVQYRRRWQRILFGLLLAGVFTLSVSIALLLVHLTK